MPPTTLNFETWLREVYTWPKDIPTECTRLDADGQDCIARDERTPCNSCAEFASACEAYEDDRKGSL